MNIKSLIILSAFAVLSNNVQAQTQKKPSGKLHQKVSSFTANGLWRGSFEIKPGTEVPINFEISNKSTGGARITFINGDERFEGGTVIQTTDSVYFKLDQFDNELALKIQGDSLAGFLRKQDGSGKATPFTATKGINYRFKQKGKPANADFSGTYDVTFTSPDGKTEKTVGLFKQNGSKLSGTFLRVTGDSRYLEGIVEGNDFYLSSFIGSTPSYYKGSFTADGKITGANISARGDTPFDGVKNINAALPDANKLTFLKEGYKTLDFSLPDVNGKKISLGDDKYKNKVVILTITGTWCPNCVDEAAFIAPWYKENRKRGVEVIALHYERQLDSAYVRKALTRFREKFGIEYDQVIAGKPDKQQVAESLPALSNFLSFPTTIIINKKGEVAQIHTGYSGPATGKYYTEFVKEFNKEIDELVGQQ